MNHSLYFRRRGRVVPPPSVETELLPLGAATALSMNLEELGYALSPDLLQACRRLSLRQLGQFQSELIDMLKPLLGAHVTHRPMYVNFPRQVMEMGQAELYWNALAHYHSAGELFPVQRKKLRNRLRMPPKLKYIDLGAIEDFEGLFTQIAAANLAWSEQDRADLGWFVGKYGDDIERLLPETVPQKENVASLAALLLTKTAIGDAFLRSRLKTATDILRVCVALNGGDVSLAKPARFVRLSRPLRRLFMERLDTMPNALEDMRRRPERWKRLGERLHPGEMAVRYPHAAHAFKALFDGLPGETFSGRVEGALREGDVMAAARDLAHRPGDFARRLDHVLRTHADDDNATWTLATFASVADRVSTPVLLQGYRHFATRGDNRKIRIFFPKGNVAKAHAEPNRLPEMPRSRDVANVFEGALLARFRMRPALGSTYVDPDLRNYPVPFAVRSASKALRTIPRGSRIPLPDGDTLRLFIWWKNGKYRTDIDLSAEFLGEGYVHLQTVAYYNLKSYGGVHSGDIVDAPNGASEFIDLPISRLRQKSVRFVAMVVNSFTEQSYVELPECFAGWMARAEPDSGEIYEPRTVEGRLDLTADTRVAIPVVFDLRDRVAVWCDMALRHHPRFVNAVGANLKGIALTVRSLAELNKPTLYDLFSLHARARGRIVTSPADADTVFSVESGLPFELERIGSEYMA